MSGIATTSNSPIPNGNWGIGGGPVKFVPPRLTAVGVEPPVQTVTDELRVRVSCRVSVLCTVIPDAVPLPVSVLMMLQPDCEVLALGILPDATVAPPWVTSASLYVPVTLLTAPET